LEFDVERRGAGVVSSTVAVDMAVVSSVGSGLSGSGLTNPDSTSRTT
jgi:hypothetical protein